MGVVTGIVCALTLIIHFLLFKKTTTYFQIISRRLRLIDSELNCIKERFHVEEEIKTRRKKLENKSVQLEEFLADLIEEGCGVVTIKPSAIFIRGMRK